MIFFGHGYTILWALTTANASGQKDLRRDTSAWRSRQILGAWKNKKGQHLTVACGR